MMRRIQPDLWETEVESPFPGLTTHAYLLLREGGNVFFYNTSQQQEIEALAPLGGVAFHYLSHRDEMGDSLRTIRERFGAKLGCHRREKDDCTKVCTPDILFDQRETYPDGIEVIPTPGHSPGSTCFLASAAAGKRYLFTGDTIYFAGDDQWRAGFIPGVTDPGEIGTLADSLRTLRQLEPDVVISSAFGGDAGYQKMSPRDWPAHVDRALEGLHCDN
jgi:glyoxylase-like metal-dependent hydrolase (beta-lactamase superfamily II)